MYCPRCAGERLVTSQSVDVEVDSCPHCRGIWLDRGELNRVVARLVAAEAAAMGGSELASLAQPLTAPPERPRQDVARDCFD